MGGTTDIKVRIKKCTNLEGNSMLPGWSSDPYVIVKLCEKKEELEKFQTKTVSNCANPEFDESHKFKKLKHPGKLKLKFEVWDSDIGRDDKIGHGHFMLGDVEATSEKQNFKVVVDGGYFTDAKLHFSIETDGTWGNPPGGEGELEVTVKNCKGLDDGDLVGKTDAYAYIEIDGCDPQQTKCISGTLNPEWNETRGPASFLPIQVAPAPPHAVSHRFTFKIDKPLGKELKVKVYDKDLGRDDVLGELQWDLCKLKMGHGPKDIEKTIDMNWMGMVKGATISLTVHNKGGWGEFSG